MTTVASGHHGGLPRKEKARQQSRDPVGEVRPGYHHSSRSDEASSRIDNQSVEQLEQYAVARSKDTTKTIKNAMRIAEDTRALATATLVSLHEQGEQIGRTHDRAVRVDEELSRGEKLLGSLGGIFSVTWRPKKAHKITGPLVHPDQYRRKINLGQRDALGLRGDPAKRSNQQYPLAMSDGVKAQLEVEKNTQDDGLSHLSYAVDQLKGITLEMGTEFDRQNGDLDRLDNDVHELVIRTKGANDRGRYLLRR